jgi:hypothetical protein
MRKIIHRIQDIGQRAAQIRDVAASVPGRAAEIRDAVLLTAGQFQQLRNEVHSSVIALRAENEDRITDALRELNEQAPTLREAGYELDGIDLELSPTQRLVVHLDKSGQTSPDRIRSLITRCVGKVTVQAVLNACLKADEMARQIQLPGLDYCQLIVHVGPSPAIRLGWRAPAVITTSRDEPGQIHPQAIATAPLQASSSPFGEGSFFERRPPLTTAQPAPIPESVPTAAAPPPPPPAPATAASVTPTTPPPPSPADPSIARTRNRADWTRSALDRFKKMPDLS